MRHKWKFVGPAERSPTTESHKKCLVCGIEQRTRVSKKPRGYATGIMGPSFHEWKRAGGRWTNVIREPVPPCSLPKEKGKRKRRRRVFEVVFRVEGEEETPGTLEEGLRKELNIYGYTAVSSKEGLSSLKPVTDWTVRDITDGR